MAEDFTVTGTSPWIHIDLSYWDDLTRDRLPQLFRKKSFLYHQDEMPEYVYIIKSGRVRVTSYRSEGEEKQLYIAEQGAMCGEFACIQNHPHDASAVAIVDSMVYCIPYQVVEKHMRGDWTMAQKVMRVICRKSNIFLGQILELSFDQSLQRVARILLDIAAQYGEKRPDGSVLITIKFTHQDIASMINTSRVTASNIFNDFLEKGTISRENGYYSLRDPGELESLLGEH
ncbi:Crp/Fnr family transcriptional regulator [Breznakiella homolactica]|uniref:Crp/Fnr family transcriptional regulator n=1 Tax=Breznakiella homolactica TaxID=2798577 RepID=A0A7T7XQZ4_9SPIR|nr:Crp/Fnr family transcriptional regulator [Breznakiella homolactica]QQO10885.1 Crp/Fnr family transcriptional regulator [Breznakiella homolactica]